MLGAGWSWGLSSQHPSGKGRQAGGRQAILQARRHLSGPYCFVVVVCRCSEHDRWMSGCGGIVDEVVLQAGNCMPARMQCLGICYVVDGMHSSIIAIHYCTSRVGIMVLMMVLCGFSSSVVSSQAPTCC